MENLSKYRREKILEFLEKLKEQNKDNDETIMTINEITRFVDDKRYGLVWEEHIEKVDKELASNIPVFTEIQEKKIKKTKDNQFNFILEGDNLHSLYLLEKTHKNKIDVIYIDPPYNTGKKKDFVYDDVYVDAEDDFKHSKWLSFMNERLRLAKLLMKETAVIFISIDEHELYALKLLCDEIFGEINYLGNLIIQTATDNNPTQVNVEHEYMIAYAKNKNKQDAWYGVSEGAILIQECYQNLKKKYDNCSDIEKELRKWIKQNENNLKRVTHYNNVDEKGVYSSSSNSSNPHPGGYMYDILHPVTNLPCPKPANGWRWTEATFKKYADEGEVAWGKDHTTQPHIKKRLETAKDQLKSIIYADNRKTTNDLSELIGKNQFNNPKSVDVLKYIFNFCSNDKSLFLDFFAGSGTTAQAVLEMNNQDDGHRKFILCTNNENNICSNVTYPRLKNIIDGTKIDGTKYSDGLPSNLKYFKTDFVPRNEEFLKESLLEHINEMIELENGIEIDNKEYLVLLSDDDVDDLEKDWANFNDAKCVFISSDCLLTESQKKMFKGIKMVEIPDYYFDFEIREAE